MTGSELCQQLRVDAARLARWLDDGLPHKLIDGEAIFNPDQVAAWLIEQGNATRDDDAPDTAGETIVRTIAEVANHFGVSTKAVANWLKDPHFPGQAGQRGRQNGRFPLEAIAAWREARDGTREDDVGSSARERKWNADAEIRELELAKLRGELIEVDVVVAEMEQAINNAKAVLSDLPDEILDELPEAVRKKLGGSLRAKIERRITQACQRLVDMVASDEDDEPEDETE